MQWEIILSILFLLLHFVHTHKFTFTYTNVTSCLFHLTLYCVYIPMAVIVLPKCDFTAVSTRMAVDNPLLYFNNVQ